MVLWQGEEERRKEEEMSRGEERRREGRRAPWETNQMSSFLLLKVTSAFPEIHSPSETVSLPIYYDGHGCSTQNKVSPCAAIPPVEAP